MPFEAFWKKNFLWNPHGLYDFLPFVHICVCPLQRLS